jgi:hypothetical protein
MCLNVGVDPPGMIRMQPCARLECWIGKYKKTEFSSFIQIKINIFIVSSFNFNNRSINYDCSKSIGNYWMYFTKAV